MPGYNFILSEDCFIFTNSGDPDEMQHNAAFHLGLTVCYLTRLGGSKYEEFSTF